MLVLPGPRKGTEGNTPKRRMILQNVDDILICSPTVETSDQNTLEVLDFLEARGYRVFHIKAQISKQQFKYLGYVINPGSRQLFPDGKQAILGINIPQINIFVPS